MKKIKVQFQWSDMYGQDTWEDKVITLSNHWIDKITDWMQSHYMAYVYFTDDVVLCDIPMNECYYTIREKVEEAFNKLS